jgi:quercetin dioxygenase-like cupin family protein
MSYAIICVGQAPARAFARKGIEVASRRPPEAIASVAKAIGRTIIVRMRILTLAVLIAGFATLIAVPAGLQAQEPPKNIVITPYITSPLEGDPSRVVRLTTVLVPAGGATPFHRHPGDQWEMVQEGEITYTVKGEEPKVLKAGDAVYIPRSTVHRNQNLSGQPVRTVELMIVDKDKPHTEPVN